jgi:hypothetical protein
MLSEKPLPELKRPETKLPELILSGDSGSFTFRLGTIFSSKYSIAMELMSRSSCKDKFCMSHQLCL